MTEPRDSAPGADEPIAPPTDGPPEGTVGGTTLDGEVDIARAEAEAMALAADELGEDDDLTEDTPAGMPLESDVDLADETLVVDESADFGIDEDPTATAMAGAATGAGAPTTDSALGTATRTGATGRAARDARPAARAEKVVVDPSVHVADPASKWFVIATIAVFGLIFLYAALLGTGGVFTPYVEPTAPPSPSAPAAPSGSVAPDGSIAPSGSAGASGSPAASGSTAPAASVAPSAAPAASGSPGPS